MSEQPDRGASEKDEKYPWSFVLLIVAAALYLGWRLLQGVGWVVDWVGG